MALPAYEKLGTFYLGRKVGDDGQDTAEMVLYDARDLTTHAVCVGMTGSGKTGLCLDLLEEAAIDGVPVLAIDPKGDIANLALRFPKLRAEDFLPWVDAGEARRKEQTPEQFAAQTAANWQRGLADWEQDGERIQRLCDAAEVAVYTPGSSTGRPVSVLRSFAAPDEAQRGDATAMKERVGGASAGLLGLLGIDADPLKSREHILISALLDAAWRAGRDLDLPALIQQIQKPPFDKVGVFDLESFYPAKERLELAMAVNNLLAAPGFSAWLEGEPLDIQRLLFGNDGKPRIAIMSIAHLNDAERMFVVTLVLNEVVAWMRRQSGTSSLRALVYMDEIFGYFPPSAMPPSKLPLLTLMKQARAFGLGVVLATQNPVDLDYKGLSNAGTWFIGRLQTERDKARVIEGLLSTASDGADRQRLESLMANLQPRVFLMRNVHEDEPVLLRTRWALSYLRGPMTLKEIAQLYAGRASPDAVVTDSQPRAVSKPVPRPTVPGDVEEYFLGMGDDLTYVPHLIGVAKVHFVDAGADVDAWQTLTLLAPLNEEGSGPEWEVAQPLHEGRGALSREAVANACFAELPAALLRAANYPAWGKQLGTAIYQSMSQPVYRCAPLKLSSTVGESEGDFRARLALKLREQRDAAVEKLRKQYAPRLQTLQDQATRAAQKIEKEKAQLSQQKLQTALSVGASILGAFLGRKMVSSTNVGRVATAARSAGRIASESQDVDQAAGTLETLQQRLTTMQAELESAIAQVQGELDAAVVSLDTVNVKPRKSDTVVSEVALVWKAV